MKSELGVMENGVVATAEPRLRAREMVVDEHAAACEAPSAPKCGRRVPLVYLLASSHSGSTLLAMVLGAQPEICTIGEMNLCNIGAPDQYHCSCGKRLAECEFWNRVSAAMRKRGFDFGAASAGMDFRLCSGWYQRRLLRPLHRGPVLEMLRDVGLMLSPGWPAGHAAKQARNLALARSLLEVSQKQILVDSSKGALRLKYLLRNPGFDVRVIRLTRDGRAVALTYMEPGRFADARDEAKRGGGAGRPAAPVAGNMSDAAELWKRSNAEAEALLSRFPAQRRFDLRYEEFCADPMGSLRRILGFLGADPARATLDFRAAAQHVVGNGMRLDQTPDIRLDERWRGVLNARQLEEFAAVAGSLNRKYGYT